MAAIEPQPTDSTRQQILTSAAQLFAERGVHGVSLREITRSANQSNTNAAQYHFGSRAAIVAAILQQHRPDIESRRHALLDQYQSEGSADIRALAAAFVLPLSSKLVDADGRAYLRIMGELINRPDPVIDPNQVGHPSDSIHRWRKLLEPLLEPDAAYVFHVRFAAMRFTHQEFARRAAASHRRDDQLFTSRVTDLVTALLGAPISTQTARLLSRRPKRQSTR